MLNYALHGCGGVAERLRAFGCAERLCGWVGQPVRVAELGAVWSWVQWLWAFGRGMPFRYERQVSHECARHALNNLGGAVLGRSYRNQVTIENYYRENYQTNNYM